VVPSASRPSTRTQPTDVDVSDSPSTVSKSAPQSRPKARAPQSGTRRVLQRWFGERRKDRDGVVSSVYPGRAYAVAAPKCDRGSTRVQSREPAKCCQETVIGPHYAR